MNLQRKRRLYFILSIASVVSVAVGLTLYALRQNISLFYSPTQVVQGEAPAHRTIRVGGMVVPGSIVRQAGETLSVQFAVTDYQHTIVIAYHGILPDLFREGQGIVAQGQLQDNKRFDAMQVLAKHDEKYMPPEVKKALTKAENPNAGLQKRLQYDS